MYQVIELYGDVEPWWFFEDWQKDLVAERDFADFAEALTYFGSRWQELKDQHSYYQSRSDCLAAFWNREDSRWCQACGEPVQNYRSLLLLLEGAPLPEAYHQESYQDSHDDRTTLSKSLPLNRKVKD